MNARIERIVKTVEPYQAYQSKLIAGVWLIERRLVDIKADDYRCEIAIGWGDIELNTIRNIGNTQYRYAYAVGLGEEQELQAEDGKCVYLYHGPSFVRIWEPVAVKDENEVAA